MKERNVGEVKKIHPATRVARQIAIPPAEFLFPEDNFLEMGGLQRAGELLEDGHSAIVYISHFSYADSVQSIKKLFRNKTFQSRPMVLPIAYHQYAKHPREFSAAGRILGFREYPIVTPDTLQYPEYESLPLGQGNVEYLEAALDAVCHSGVILFAPQVGRRPYLGEPERVVGLLLTKIMNEIRSPKLVFVPIGLSLARGDGYISKENTGYNLRKPFSVKAGPAVTLDEMIRDIRSSLQNDVEKGLISQYRESREIPLIIKRSDAWAFQQLACLVPQNYRGTYECEGHT